jgi:cytochrome c oxidase subunit 4
MAANGRRHITGIGYTITFAALLFLATVSLLLSFLHWTTGDLIASLFIAGLKSVLVLWFFMHLYEQRFSNRVVVLVSLFFVVLLVTLTSADIASRHTFPMRSRPTRRESFYLR